MADLYDALESRDPAAREKDLFSALPALIYRAQQAKGWSTILKGIDAAAITSRRALADLPVTRKSELKDLQKSSLPFGGLTTTATSQLSRIFMSPGPLFDPIVVVRSGYGVRILL